jgi:hypothetical protein
MFGLFWDLRFKGIRLIESLLFWFEHRFIFIFNSLFPINLFLKIILVGSWIYLFRPIINIGRKCKWGHFFFKFFIFFLNNLFSFLVFFHLYSLISVFQRSIISIFNLFLNWFLRYFTLKLRVFQIILRR